MGYDINITSHSFLDVCEFLKSACENILRDSVDIPGYVSCPFHSLDVIVTISYVLSSDKSLAFNIKCTDIAEKYKSGNGL